MIPDAIPGKLISPFPAKSKEMHNEEAPISQVNAWTNLIDMNQNAGASSTSTAPNVASSAATLITIVCLCSLNPVTQLFNLTGYNGFTKD